MPTTTKTATLRESEIEPWIQQLQHQGMTVTRMTQSGAAGGRVTITVTVEIPSSP